ncbi:MAG: DciA family protein [Gemmatimonadales bacterium]
MKDRPSGPPVPIGEALTHWIRHRSGIARRLDQADAVLSWADCVGPQVAAVTRPESVTPDGVMRVRVPTHQWATELGLMTPRILARLNQNRKGRILHIRWIVGPLDPDHPQPDRGHG